MATLDELTAAERQEVEIGLRHWCDQMEWWSRPASRLHSAAQRREYAARAEALREVMHRLGLADQP